MPIPAPVIPPNTITTTTNLPGGSTLVIEGDFSQYNERPKAVPAETAVYQVTASTTGGDAPAMFRCDATAGAITLTFPYSNSAIGRIIYIVKSDSSANAITLAVQSGDNLWKPSTLTTLTSQYQVCALLAATNGTVTGWQCISVS